jgi:8-oxo-dGTP pyrophosphatase MutT (NUDIX family)
MTDPRLVGLEALLTSHVPFGDQEAGYLATMQALLGTGGDSLSRLHFDPGHFTASGFVVSPDRASLLLVHHAKLDKWLQPGGHIEPEDADLESAGRREVHEETGLRDLEILGLLDVDIHRFPERGDDPAHHHLDVRFGFRAQSRGVFAGDGTVEVKWFALPEVVEWTDRPSLSRPARKLLVPRD